MTVDIFIFILGGTVHRHDKYNHYRLLTMNYHLSFLDDDGRVQDVREGVFETDDTAKRWMRIVGERGLAITSALQWSLGPRASCCSGPGRIFSASLEIQMAFRA
jgi:hypothetical protein